MSEVGEMAAWLREQAETDLQAAGAATPGPWVPGGSTKGTRWLPRDCVHAPDYRPEGFSHGQNVAEARVADGGMGLMAASVRGSGFPEANAAHIAAHDPRTETARAESVLEALDLYERTAGLVKTPPTVTAAAWPGAEPQPGMISALDYQDARRELAVLEAVIRQLGYGYRFREGYKEEWKP